MIYDKIERACLYDGLPCEVIKAIEYIKTIKPDTPDGKYPLFEDKIVAQVQSYDTLQNPGDTLEGHLKYVDIQAVIEGEEYISVTPLDGLKNVVPYSEERDMAFFQSPDITTKLAMRPGTFVVLFPNDAHLGKFAVKDGIKIKKVVIKVALGLFSR